MGKIKARQNQGKGFGMAAVGGREAGESQKTILEQQ